MYCKNCGSQLSDTAKYCPNCGTQLHIDTKQPQEATVKTITDHSATNAMPMTSVPDVSKIKTYPFAVWKLVSGIISLVFSVKGFWASGLMLYQ